MIESELIPLKCRLMQVFLQKVAAARARPGQQQLLERFALAIAVRHVTCITFNYDDFLDAALGATGDRWNPYTGYGFRFPGSIRRLSEFYVLKLHGSVNWVRSLSAAQYPHITGAVYKLRGPYERDDFTEWGLESMPVVVPPTIGKRELAGEPILRTVWRAALASLRKAERVVFVGCSLPQTDFCARSLFVEGLQGVQTNNIKVVNLGPGKSGRAEKAREQVSEAYRKALGRQLTKRQFFWDGAVPWAQQWSESLPTA